MLSMTVRFGAEEANIEEAITKLDLYLGSLNVGPEHQFQILTCCREVLNNVIEHGRCAEPKCPLVFSLTIEIRQHGDERTAKVQITDNGEPFDPPESVVSEPQSLALSGRGWTILRQWSDGLTFQRHDGHNQLTFSKKLSRQAN